MLKIVTILPLHWIKNSLLLYYQVGDIQYRNVALLTIDSNVSVSLFILGDKEVM